MKKATSLVIALALVSMFFASCKSHELCPAYGKADTKIKSEKPV